jgi:hypothetical protein
MFIEVRGDLGIRQSRPAGPGYFKWMLWHTPYIMWG